MIGSSLKLVLMRASVQQSKVKYLHQELPGALVTECEGVFLTEAALPKHPHLGIERDNLPPMLLSHKKESASSP